MLLVEKFDNAETADVHVEMDVAAFKIRRTGSPDFCLRVEFFNFEPDFFFRRLCFAFRVARIKSLDD